MFCSSCGTKNSDEAKFCSSCGASLVIGVTQPVNSTPKPQDTIKSEKVFLDDEWVLVSNARYIVKSTGQTLAMNQINSVSVWTELPSKSAAFWCFGLSIIGFFIYVIPGLILVGLGIFLWIQAKPKYYTQVTTSSGLNRPLYSLDNNYTQKVVDAINEAIIFRG